MVLPPGKSPVPRSSTPRAQIRETKRNKRGKNIAQWEHSSDLLIPTVSSSDFGKYLLEIWKEFKVWRTSARGL